MEGDSLETATSLRDFKYKLQVLLQDPTRGLDVKHVTLIFDPETVYGQRSGMHDAFLVTHAGGGAGLRKLQVFRRQTVDKIHMLARQVASRLIQNYGSGSNHGFGYLDCSMMAGAPKIDQSSEGRIYPSKRLLSTEPQMGHGRNILCLAPGLKLVPWPLPGHGEAGGWEEMRSQR